MPLLMSVCTWTAYQSSARTSFRVMVLLSMTDCRNPPSLRKEAGAEEELRTFVLEFDEEDSGAVVVAEETEVVREEKELRSEEDDPWGGAQS